MREKLKTLPLAELKELAKGQGLKGISGMRKADIIDLLCREAEKNQPEAAEKPEATEGQEATQKMDTTEKPEAVRRPAQLHREPAAQGARRELGATEARKETRPPEARKRVRMPDKRRMVRSTSEMRQESGASEHHHESHLETRQESFSPEQRQDSRKNQSRSYERPFQPRSQQPRNFLPGQQIRTYNSNNSGAQPRSYTAPAPQLPAAQLPVQQPPAADAAGAESAERSRADLRGEVVSFSSQDMAELDSGIEANGILEVMPDGFGFIRCENFLPGENDVYVAPSQIRRFNLKTGDIIVGNRRVKAATEKFAALLFIKTVNGYPLSTTETRPNFEDLTPIFPNQRLHMENYREKTSVAMRILDLLAPIGKGQRGMIVSPPKAGKTTLLKQVAKAITTNHPEMHLMILLIDERPEEVTDIREAVVGPNVEVIYSTFDEQAERHKRVSEMVIERAKRLVEHGRDVIILLDSITRLARAYNLTVAPSGRTLSGGLDPAALYMPKRFFGAARNMREGGSLTILATALVDTGSRMDDVVYEEFKGTGNMELVLDRKLSEKRIFPAIDILKSGTRRDDLLLTREEEEAVEIIRKATNSLRPEEAVERILDLFSKTRNNREFVDMVKKVPLFR